VRSGTISDDEAVGVLKRLPFADLGDSLVDHHRALRQGMPETVYGPGKSADQITRIVAELFAAGTDPVLVTRIDDDQ
ncbi:MAG TPA: 1-(5-phosphoribosyl)-5-amino-4-imidazole-carboxylate carboxylase, partial [Ilumatobacteraceae bacterium]|nr:1-(5-phosphoribosyl)-5-amino-4-imidazole-carboxylate carboxylase [Ilumatobacteraceae bacterium]